MSQREYIFWLENQCEILSIQMLKSQMKLECFIDENLEEELDDERNQYLNTMRFQYEDTIFE